MRAEVSGDVGQGVALEHHAKGAGEVALVNLVQVGGDVLLDGAARATRRREAAGERQRRGHLVRLGGLDGLAVERALRHGLVKRGHGLHAHLARALGAREDARDLAEALVAAGLEHGGGHGDGPDARAVEIGDVGGVGAAGVADAQLAVELGGNLVGEVDGKREQRAAAHVHLLARQLLARDVHREGVGELHAKAEAALGGEGDETVKHRHGVCPLQVLDEVLVVEGDVVKAERVQALASVVVAQKRGVALDVGVEALLADEVGGDALDLCRRAAMEGGLGDRGGDVRAHGVHELLVHLGKAAEVGERPVAAGLPHLGVARVLHVLDVGVHLGALDALEVVAHAHVEDEAVRRAQAKLAGEQLAGPPGLDVLVLCLRDLELG